MVRQNHKTDMRFTQFLKRLSSQLKGIVWRLRARSGSFNDEDLYQEATVKLWEDFKGGRLADKTRSYILQGCYFHLKNFLRSTYPRCRTVSLETFFTQEGGEPLEERLRADDRDSASLVDRLSDLLLADTIRNNGFSQREKKILSCISEGMTLRQIGRRLGISHVMVGKHLSKLREKCRVYRDEN